MKKQCLLIMRILFVYAFLLITSQRDLFGQKPATAVDGTVVNEKGEPLQGVVVELKNGSARTLTDKSGKFSITIKEKTAELMFSYTGYLEKTVTVSEASPHINLTMNLDTKSIEDVVVIGYNTVKKKDVTGAVAGITSKDIQSRPVVNALQAMQGKVSGVDITSNERPGTIGNITIRGIRSISASSNPLFVVDGIPLTTGGIDNLNPNDIETIDVLKDASATAVYGSRGANGVVIVTTKQGKSGKATLTINSAVTGEKLIDKNEAMSAAEYIEFRRWAYYYQNPTGNPRGDQPTIAKDQVYFLATADPTAWSNILKGWATGTWDGSKVATTDWKGIVTQPGLTTDNTISVSAGSDKVKAYASFGYLNNRGTQKGQIFQRYTAKANVDITANKWFSMGVNINVNYGVQQFGQSSTNIGTIGSPANTLYESARGLFPYAMPYDSTGARILYPGGDNAFKNVVDEWDYTKDERTTIRAFGSLYTQINFGGISPALKGLKYRLNFGPDFQNYRQGIYIDANSVASGGSNYASLSKSQIYSYTLDHLFYYDRNTGKHSFGFTGLISQTEFNSENNSLAATGIPFSSQLWNALSNNIIPTSQLSSYSSGISYKSLLSYMGRVNYSYNDKYLLTASVRADGASQLAEGNKYSSFPSVALGWRINKENFMKGTNWINDLKLRAGYGETGNSDIAPYSSKEPITPIFYPAYGTVITGATLGTQLANPKLTWERTSQYNFGIDFSLFNRRVSGGIDYYFSTTDNLIFRQPLPSVTGYQFTYANIGATKNKGVDFSLNTLNINKKDFQWNTNLTVTWSKETITKLVNGDDIANSLFIGQQVGVIYGIQGNGLWHIGDSLEYKKFNANGHTFSPGNARPVDQNGDYKVDANYDRIIIGNTRPRWVVGMTNTFNYKGFELAVFIYGRLGYWYNTGGEAQVGRGVTRKINYYTENNQNAEYQKPIYSTATGDPFSNVLGYRKADFIKVRNISMSYTFNSKSLTKFGMSNFKTYLQIANPGMLFSKIDWIDMDLVSSVYNRGVTIGINASF